MEKVLILGAGAAGLTAAIYTGRAKLHPVVIEGLQPGGQLMTTTEVENFPGFSKGIMGPELMEEMKKQAAQFEARFISASIVSADFKGMPLKVSLEDGSVHEALAVIIATGASAKYLGLESEQKLIGHGVSACATCDGAFFRHVPVAVVGGGDTAMEESMFLTRFASKVYLIHRRDQFRASKIMADRVLQHPKIEIMWNSVVEEVFDVVKKDVTGLRLKNVTTNKTSELAVHALFTAIGFQPNTEPFKGQIDMDAIGYIQTTNTRTNVRGVFAAGDVQDPLYRQAITAAGSGCVAALEVQRYLEA